MPAPASLPELAASLRAFSRFYTRFIGILHPQYLGTRFSIAEARILYDLGRTKDLTASGLAESLAMDSGYVSRILSRFARQGLLARSRSRQDRRRRPLALTASGLRTFHELDTRSQRQMEEPLRKLSPGQKTELLHAVRTIERSLGGARPQPVFLVRAPRPGDFGWVVAQHGALYASEYGWDQTFEGLVAGLVADFLKLPDGARAKCWIAERDGENVGCVFLVPRSRRVAQLRMLLVDPSARGHGLGGRLVDECIRHARQAGYRKIMLWTNSVLREAAGIYRRAGFHITVEEKHHSFGRDLVAQTWERDL